MRQTSLVNELQQDKQYQGWIADISRRFRNSQIKVVTDFCHKLWPKSMERALSFRHSSANRQQVVDDSNESLANDCRNRGWIKERLKYICIKSPYMTTTPVQFAMA